MLAKVFLGLFVGLFCTRTGESIKCYSYACSNYTTTPHPTCAPPKVITCQTNHNSLIPPDRCMIQRVIGKPGDNLKIHASVHHEIRGCANHLECKMSRFCEDAKNHGNIDHCETTCCKGDLCNREGPVARQVADPKGPTGSDLYCYACSNVTEPGQVPGIKCSRPIKQRCGIDPLISRPQDRCLTIIMAKKQEPIGKMLYQEIRNCSSTHYCSNDFCAQANMTGSLAKCKVQCCTSKMCNNEGIPKRLPKMRLRSTTKPTTTAVQGDKFARQGIPSFFPTKEAKPKGSSPGQPCLKLEIVIGIFAVSCMFID